MRRIFAVLVAVMFASVLVHAQPGTGTWTNTMGGTCLSVSSFDACHFEFTTTTDSSRLEVPSRDFNVHLFATGGCDVYVMRCSDKDCTAGESHKVLPDTDGDGVRDDVTLDGSNMRTGMQNVQGRWVWVDVQTAPAAATCRVTVEAH